MGSSNEILENTEDVIEEKKEKIKEILPSAFTEGDLDKEKLEEILETSDRSDQREKYEFTWAGKSKCLDKIKQPTNKTLKPDKEESLKFDQSENLFIEGENLEALKILRRAYHGKIKMIYIDPPYNTGKNRVYKDDWEEGKKEYEERTGQRDEKGRLVSNPETSGRYHSNWLTMMYPRLFLARDLLQEDGVMFISIDDNELHNLLLILNEIFGEENVDTMVWKKVTSNEGKLKMVERFRKDHEYILAVYKDKSQVKFSKVMKYPEIERSETRNRDDDPRGDWISGNISKREEKSNEDSENYYSVTSPTGHKTTREWKFPKEKFEELDEDDRIYWGEDGTNVPRLKVFVNEKKPVYISSIIKKRGTAKSASKHLQDIFGENIYDNPKPVDLIKYLIEFIDDDDFLVMDFFAGSGTTAEAVIEKNEEDGGSRNFALVQLDEETSEDSKERELGFDTVSEIARERIRKVAPESVGFKSLRLENSNFVTWDPPEDKKELEKQMELQVDPLKPDSIDEDVIYELLLKEGFTLNAEIEKLKTGEKTVSKITEGEEEMFLSLEDEITPQNVEELIDPETTFVCFDFALTDSAKDNIARSCDLKTI